MNGVMMINCPNSLADDLGKLLSNEVDIMDDDIRTFLNANKENLREEEN